MASSLVFQVLRHFEALSFELTARMGFPDSVLGVKPIGCSVKNGGTSLVVGWGATTDPVWTFACGPHAQSHHDPGLTPAIAMSAVS